MEEIHKIAFGGSCHWCTEAIFQSLRGVKGVKQGFIASDKGNESFSEAVIVSYLQDQITLKELVLIHLHTHNSTANHTMRDTYRSAIYTFNPIDGQRLQNMWGELQGNFDSKLITEILRFKAFRPSATIFHNYYYSNPRKPFCKKYIDPKLTLLQEKFSNQLIS